MTPRIKTKATRGLKKLCSRVVKAEGLKANGTLKKGFRYVKGRKIVKAGASTTTKTKSNKKK
jgi:hypothetical protein